MSVYLDHASGWPLSAGVREAMARWIDEPGSPMALHDHARGPAQVVDDAHAAVAALVGWPAESVILTSGATEARNLAMKGTLSPGNGRPGDCRRSLGPRVHNCHCTVAHTPCRCA